MLAACRLLYRALADGARSCVDSKERKPGPIRLGDGDYGRVEVAGTIGLHDGKAVPVEVEVTRRVLGLHDTVGQGGTQRQLDLVQAWPDDRPSWWGWWNWPHWWFVHDGFAEFRWRVTVAPGASASLDVSWHHFWR